MTNTAPATRMSDQEVLDALVKFDRLHAVRPTTHTDIMTMALRTEARIRGLI